MNVWTGVVTTKLSESRDFYRRLFGCEIVFDSDWFVLLRLGNSEIGFLAPDHPSQASIFRPGFAGKGIWLALEVEDVDAEFRRLQALGVRIEVELRNEPWGDRHFVIVDPNGVAIDVITRTQTS